MDTEGFLKAGRKRPAPEASRVTKRVARFLGDEAEAPGCQEENDRVPKEVQPLNAGFFRLETMRDANVAKARTKRKAKVKGK